MLRCPSCGAEIEDGSNFCPHDGTPLQHGVKPWRDPLLGTVVSGRYRILNRLGMGGMAIVYLAKHMTLDLDVALKVLRSGFEGDGRIVARFAREARATSRIDHDNVVQLLDFACAEQGFYYLVTEYIPGAPLEAEIERIGALPAARATHILAQLAAGLARAHELGIVHRDLKPANVMLMQRGSDRDFVKILDFGLARSMQHDPEMPSLTRAGELFGTPEYMAPEQWEGGHVDARADVYALGAMAYELVTGRPPFLAETLPEIMRLHAMEPPMPPSARKPDAEIPPELERLILRCLRKQPAERYRSVAELLGDLGKAWGTARRVGTMTTYARTSAAPPPPSPDSIPDPTVYQSSNVDIVWDGPTLCDEIRRLHALRGKRLQELAAVLWGSHPSAEVIELMRPIAELERAVERHGQEVALLRARIQELGAHAREREAELRVAMIDASFAVSASYELVGFADTRPAVVLPEASAEADRKGTESRPPTMGGPQAVLRWAERRLAAHHRRMTHEQADLEGHLVDRMAALREKELELMPLYERLSKIVAQHAGRRRDVRPQLVAYGQIDGAIASYQALLEMLDLA